MVVHDARRQAAEKICAAGAEWADTPKAVAEATEVVFTSLPGPREFEAVVRGDNEPIVTEVPKGGTLSIFGVGYTKQ